jgi:hypothetical protein
MLDLETLVRGFLIDVAKDGIKSAFTKSEPKPGSPFENDNGRVFLLIGIVASGVIFLLTL